MAESVAVPLYSLSQDSNRRNYEKELSESARTVVLRGFETPLEPFHRVLNQQKTL